jgi:hypothetical protein
VRTHETVDRKALKKEFKSKGVSPNRLKGHKYVPGGGEGYEWLHMSARSFGTPTTIKRESRPGNPHGKNWKAPESPSLGDWRNQNYYPSQHPLNLVHGSYGSNTYMMAVEGAAKGTDTKTGATKLKTKAYSKGNKKHLSDLVSMSLYNQVGGRLEFFIDSTNQVVPTEGYKHMKERALEFVQGDTTGHEYYQYPSRQELELLRKQPPPDDGKKRKVVIDDPNPSTKKKLRKTTKTTKN